MTDEELLQWVRQTITAYETELPVALAILKEDRAMSYGQISRRIGGWKGTVYRRAKRATRPPA